MVLNVTWNTRIKVIYFSPNLRILCMPIIIFSNNIFVFLKVGLLVCSSTISALIIIVQCMPSVENKIQKRDLGERMKQLFLVT